VITTDSPADPVDDGYATFEDLTEHDAAAETRDVTLPSGRKVQVRGLSRYEIHLGGKIDDASKLEAFNLSTCVVKPKLTAGQALAWMKRAKAGGDIAELTTVIRDMSGLGKGADKSDVQSV
jgi:hypothetical protein